MFSVLKSYMYEYKNQTCFSSTFVGQVWGIRFLLKRFHKSEVVEGSCSMQRDLAIADIIGTTIYCPLQEGIRHRRVPALERIIF